MKVSVIIPIYNAEKWLLECLDSISQQTYKDMEVILVDDGSTDASGKICDDYAAKDNRFIAIHQPNGGVSKARNVGTNRATGDIVTYVDSDDVFANDMLECAVGVFEKYDVDVVYGGVRYIEPGDVIDFKDGESTNVVVLNPEYVKRLFYNMIAVNQPEFIFDGCFISKGPGAKFLKANIAKMFLFNERLEIGEDQIWNMELLKSGLQYAVLRKYCYAYINNSKSTLNTFRKKIINQMSLLITEMLKFDNGDQLARREYVNKLFLSLQYICNKYYLHPDYRYGVIKGFLELKAMLREYPWNYYDVINDYDGLTLKEKRRLFLLKYNLLLPYIWIKNKEKSLRRIIKG